VAQFKAGLNPKLGYNIVRVGAPPDDDLEAWYTRSTEMVRAFRDAKRFYGDQGGKRIPKPNTSTSSNAVASSLKKDETKPKEETREVKLE
jgi:hypothetical protein